MNEITICGNVTADPVLRFGRDGDATAFLAFTVAVNRSYFEARAGARTTFGFLGGGPPRHPPRPAQPADSTVRGFPADVGDATLTWPV
jgi:hypothetical protein